MSCALDDFPRREVLQRVEVAVPVVCQNGHRATWLIVINGLDVRQYAPRDACDCPKHSVGDGWQVAGEPVVTRNYRA